ncbi:ubiquitin carboxyl-terminal hydrolase 2 [Ascobolus immersus RN42]|uniref:Ubiquitin carboxyl-terminal hydrolase n=1 Tax=Ascobolus immersus RN42 TaxID=1160509 RepID=A0A3N4HQ39_ASCIM|nr:ubiquitin carboxyl-terminal hydrolase 2 [Ascobolus immersus RN42]
MSGWQTIESDAGVFTHLIEELGVPDIQFEEIHTLDADALKALPQVYGVVFLFHYNQSATSNTENSSTPKDGDWDYQAAEDIFFANQTIQNACGTQAILSILLNQDINIGPTLAAFKEFTTGFPSELKGESLSNSEQIREVHNTFAKSSPFVDESTRPATSDDDAFHFVAYTVVNNKLYELDGLQRAPISHGACTKDEFPEKIISVLQKRIARYPDGEIRFNLLAVTQDKRIRARELGDEETLEAENKKREEWKFENELRKHNFVGFTIELLRGVVKDKIKTGEYDAWVKDATDKAQARIAEQQQKRRE